MAASGEGSYEGRVGVMRFAKFFLGGAAVFGLAGAATAGPTSIVQNGSFEEPVISAGSFQQFSTIPGWTGNAGVEIQSNGVLGAEGGTPFGNQYVELNVQAPSALTQTLTTTPGAQYTVSFWFAARPGTGTNSATATFTGAPALPVSVPATGSVAFQQFTETVTATGASSVLSFTPTGGLLAGAGNLLDNVSVTPTAAAVPLPSAVWAGLCGLACLGLAARAGKAVSSL
jgi:hypothetical protein